MSTDSELEDCGNLPYELHRKMVAEAFWNVEIESELREANMISHKFTSASSREDLMCTVDEQRAKTTYQHGDCSEECRKRGIVTSSA